MLAFESFGLKMSVRTSSDELLARVRTVLPPGWTERDPSDGGEWFSLISRDRVTYRVEREESSLSGSSDLDVALKVLENELRTYVSLHGKDRVFVHAGAVGVEGRAILIPGASFSGKTTLVAELVRAGASYYSDELAVLDGDGRVHPYPKPLSLRLEGLSQTDHHVSELGGRAGEEPLEVGLVVVSRYVPDAAWSPQPLSGGEAVLALLENTVAAQARPAETLEALRRAVDGAVALQGERGEAGPVVDGLLDLMR